MTTSSKKLQNIEKKPPKGAVKFSIKLSDEQKKAKEQVLRHPVNFLVGPAGSGKAQPLDCKVYTPTGPKLMKDIKVGDKVSTPNGEASVIGIYPQGIEDVYRITCSDKSQTECSLNHLWTVQKKADRKTGPWITITTRELKEKLESGIEFRIPQQNVVSFDHQDVRIDPYLLGILISEGSLQYSSKMFSTSDTFILEKVKRILRNTDTKVKHKGRYDYRIIKRKKGPKKTFIAESIDFYKLNVNSYSKHIPNCYKYNSVEVRTGLLQGLIDGDGYVTKNGKLLYNTSSKVLCKDVCELVRSLGGRVTVSDYYPKYEYLGKKLQSTDKHYQISITIVDSEKYATLPRKKARLKSRKHKVKYIDRIIKSVEKSRETFTQCIKIDSDEELYITDDFIVTHNTMLGCQIALDMFFKRSVNKIIVTRPTVSTQDDGFLPGGLGDKMEPWLVPIRSNMRKLYNKPDYLTKLEADETIELISIAHFRGRSFDDAIIIVDEFQNLTKPQLAMCISRLGKGSTMIFCGDNEQIDLPTRDRSAYHDLPKLTGSHYVSKNVLEDNHRHPALKDILKRLTNTY